MQTGVDVEDFDEASEIVGVMVEDMCTLIRAIAQQSPFTGHNRYGARGREKKMELNDGGACARGQ